MHWDDGFGESIRGRFGPNASHSIVWSLLKEMYGMRNNDAVSFGRGVFLLWLMSALLVVFGVAFAAEKAISPSGKPSIFVVNYPLKYFAERIAGDHAEVKFPAPPNVDPAFWNPDIQTIAAYQRADLILLNGAGYAKWTKKVSLPQFRLVNTSANHRDRYLERASLVNHTHGPTGEHKHEGLAFTTWLDFDLAAKQARAISNAMTKKWPRLRGTFERNFSALEKDLLSLDRAMGKVASQIKEVPLLVSHPVYDYLAKRYGLNIKSLHWEPDQVPEMGELQKIRELLKKHPAKWIIWEAKPLAETQKKLDSMGIKSIVFHPSENVPEKGHFLDMMRNNVENLKRAKAPST
jgi:zinc transport system substrate-binding protein